MMKLDKKEKLIQFVNWGFLNKWHFGFIRGNPLKQPAAFHLIYKWSIWIGFIEIRKFLTDKEMGKALKIYHENNQS